MAISPLTSPTAAAQAASNASATAAASAAAAKANQTISSADFLKLLSTEMASQDPMKPMDPTQSMTQIGEFSTLQAMNGLQTNTALATASSFLGATVSVPGLRGGAPITGVVTGIDGSQVAGGGAPKLIIKGALNEYPVTAVTQITLTPPASTGTPAPSPTTTTPSAIVASNPSSTKH